MTYNDELYHYGVLGMKWGKRRYTNPDGTLNALGKKRQAMRDARVDLREARREYSRATYENDKIREYGLRSAKSDMRVGNAAKASVEADAKYKQAKKEFKELKKQTIAEAKASKAATKGEVAASSALSAIAGAAVGTVAATGIVAVGAYKIATTFLDGISD